VDHDGTRLASAAEKGTEHRPDSVGTRHRLGGLEHVPLHIDEEQGGRHRLMLARPALDPLPTADLRRFGDAGLQLRWRRHIPEGTSGHTLVLCPRT
jgi:hypothetical protein